MTKRLIAKVGGPGLQGHSSSTARVYAVKNGYRADVNWYYENLPGNYDGEDVAITGRGDTALEAIDAARDALRERAAVDEEVDLSAGLDMLTRLGNKLDDLEDEDEDEDDTVHM